MSKIKSLHNLNFGNSSGAKNRNHSKIKILIKERVKAFLSSTNPLGHGWHQQRKVFNVCSVESFHFRSQESLWFWSHKKVATTPAMEPGELNSTHTRTAKQLKHSCSSLARDGSGPASLRKKSNLAHQVTWPDLIQSPGSLGFMTNPHWGENSTCKTWLERSAELGLTEDQLATFFLS